jgi:hypothetical protein
MEYARKMLEDEGAVAAEKDDAPRWNQLLNFFLSLDEPLGSTCTLRAYNSCAILLAI